MSELDDERDVTDLGLSRAVDDDEREHDDCTDGWAGEDRDGHPIPCPHCRPELVEKLRRQRERAREGWCRPR